MARSVETIKQQIIDAKNAESALSGLTSTSQTAIWNLWAYITALAINIFEQILDQFKIEVENIADTSASGSPAWIRARVFEFQYDATTPQIATIIDNKLQYPAIDETKRIVTRCSVLTKTNAYVDVKVAKGTTPTPLAAGEAQSLLGYLNTFNFAGININLINQNSDKIYVAAEIYYDGQYAAVIQANVIEAIENYFAQLPFDGKAFVAEIEDAIQSVAGVKDVKITTIKGRSDATLFANASIIFDLATGVNNKSYSTVAGYVVGETTVSNTLADTLTFIIA